MKVEKQQLKILIPLVLGIFCILMSVIADPAFKVKTVDTGVADTEGLSVDSNLQIGKVHAHEFSLVEGQRIRIEFSIHDENMSAGFFILGKATYLSYKSANVTAPNVIDAQGLTLPFVAYAPTMNGAIFGTAMTEATFTYDGTLQAEFAGEVNADDVISVPGDYVLVVYGTNVTGDMKTTLQYSLKITTEGDWKAVETTFAVLAFVLLAIAGVIALMEFRPSLFGGNEE